mgnify:FL=1|tara:strand:+ start:57328 stop:57888 length:561 start_codon:yes stop_codon:yes gene_type:complete
MSKIKRITAFIGFEGSGKDFSTNQLLNYIQGSIRIGMSDGIRKEAFEQMGIEPIYGTEYEKWKTELCGYDGFTGRDLLKEIGEGRRKDNPYVWSEKWFETCLELKPKDIIVNDCRFWHEVRAIIRFATEYGYKFDFVYCQYPSERLRVSNEKQDMLAYKFHLLNAIHYSVITPQIKEMASYCSDKI